jgi:hypothetical protein
MVFGGYSVITNLKYIPAISFLGESFMANTKVLEFNLHNNFFGIAHHTFEGATKLTSITTDESGRYASVDGVLLTNDLTTLLVYPPGIQSNTYLIPDSIENFDVRVFSVNPYLTDILTSANNQNFTSVDGILYSLNSETIIFYPHGRIQTTYSLIPNTKVIANYAFLGNKQLEEVILNPELIEIGEGAFGDSNISIISIPESVTTIGRQAFFRAHQLKIVNLQWDTPRDKNLIHPIFGFNHDELTIFVPVTGISQFKSDINFTEYIILAQDQ